MTRDSASISFARRDLKGSRLRCLLTTQQDEVAVAEFLSSLVAPHATVESGAHRWAPRGLRDPGEAKLGETAGFLNDAQRQTITNWWLEQSGTANTPNWDLLSQCDIDGGNGLILVEAKAHEGELGNDRSGATGANAIRIRAALQEATDGWNQLLPGFSLSFDSHFQLSNRFAFAWKLAEMGIPVVLVYLGFLETREMDDGRRTILHTSEQWQDCVLRKSRKHVPEEAWNSTFDVNGTPVTVLIRCATVSVDGNVEAEATAQDARHPLRSDAEISAEVGRLAERRGAARESRRARFEQVVPQPNRSIVAWVDLLGFREQMCSADTPDKLQAAYRRMRDVQAEFDKESASVHPDQGEMNAAMGKRVIALSDGLVIALNLENSSPVTEYSSRYDRIGFFLEGLRVAQAELAYQGNFLRGGVSFGHFWFEDDILLSPALVDAYEMESKLARNPVIVLKRELADAIRSMRAGEGYAEDDDPMSDLFRDCEWMEDPARSEHVMLDFMPV